ncbi:MAG: YihY/virulence factor BrkB family protein [Micrococcaceae bacterium]|nr:YihY/virulence factor BrkB family protein [Micrococcaceae bacterium]
MPGHRHATPENGTAADTSAKGRNAPSPDDDRKPSAPTDLRGPSWKYVLKRSMHEFTRNKCTDMAAGLTYHAVLSVFPALLAMVSLLGVVGQAESTTKALIGFLEQFASEGVVDTLRPPIEQLANTPSAGLALIVGILGALWSASGYTGAFGRSMNKIYDVAEGRSFFKLKPVLLLVTLVMLLVAVVVVVLLIVSGPIAKTLGDLIGFGATAVMVWGIAKWPLAVLLVILVIAILYYGTPNVKQPKFRWLSIGSVIALVVLAVATVGFFFYVSNFGSYNATYGAIGGGIVLRLWIWIANLSLLLGAVFDAEMERARQLQGGIKAERSVQLPPRDTKASDKQALVEERDVQAGSSLRHQSVREPEDS